MAWRKTESSLGSKPVPSSLFLDNVYSFSAFYFCLIVHKLRTHLYSFSAFLNPKHPLHFGFWCPAHRSLRLFIPCPTSVFADCVVRCYCRCVFNGWIFFFWYFKVPFLDSLLNPTPLQMFCLSQYFGEPWNHWTELTKFEMYSNCSCGQTLKEE